MSDRPKAPPQSSQGYFEWFKYFQPSYHAGEYLKARLNTKLEEQTPDAPLTDAPARTLEKRGTTLSRLSQRDLPQATSILAFTILGLQAVDYFRTGGHKHVVEDMKEVTQEEASRDLQSWKSSQMWEGLKTSMATRLVTKEVADEVYTGTLENTKTFAKEKTKAAGAEFGFSMAVGLLLKGASNFVPNTYAKMGLKGLGRGWQAVGILTLGYLFSDLGKKTQDPSMLRFRRTMETHQRKRVEPMTQEDELEMLRRTGDNF